LHVSERDDSFATVLFVEDAMSREGLFEDLPQVESPEAMVSGKPRMREPLRDQIALQAVDLDSVIGVDHPARVIWAYVEGLDLSVLEEAIKAREHGPGQAPVSPRLLLALWLYGTSEGVGQRAGAGAALCEPRRLSLAVRRGERELPRAGGFSQRPG
jgi:hypothetical protein